MLFPFHCSIIAMFCFAKLQSPVLCIACTIVRSHWKPCSDGNPEMGREVEKYDLSLNGSENLAMKITFIYLASLKA